MKSRSSRTLDRIDRAILRLLQKHGRITNAELAGLVSLSPPPCLERVRRLEREGYIRGYRAELDPAKLDAGLLVFVTITLDRTTPDVFQRFAAVVHDVPAVQECHMVAGGFDYLLKLRCADMAAYRDLLGEKLAALPGVLQTHTYVVMEEVKNTPEIEVD
ncbi:AsnC family transcriptional regulator [Plasticicumulans lactativorans]|uniref:Leucine-responsive regulatory protein n=1 Tax=Plasticicumulans lactativorans TaxID=1133106 RepID=A0A4R2L6K7_9GAMM|nr:Lrp/AsnC ligand binding domain-containing protein [Plasticicumulans lactativorans]TCO83038.1 AsnC family transcriptional regulator [Plasticicumulans lactativorans]